MYHTKAVDPHAIGFLDPDPGGVKSAKAEGGNRAKRQIIHHKKLNWEATKK
jgi:hypothetical protein